MESRSALPEVESVKLIYKPKNKYNLQEALGFKNEKQRWLTYLEIMRECIYEKNVNFDSNYRTQKHAITSQIIRAFKKKAPDFPVTAGDWAVKQMLVNTIQNKRYYLKKKNTSQDPPSPAEPPAPQDPPSPAEPPAPQDPPSPVINLPKRGRQRKNNKENHNRGKKPKPKSSK